LKKHKPAVTVFNFPTEEARETAEAEVEKAESERLQAKEEG
jgi:hypothetical protein